MKRTFTVFILLAISSLALAISGCGGSDAPSALSLLNSAMKENPAKSINTNSKIELTGGDKSIKFDIKTAADLKGKKKKKSLIVLINDNYEVISKKGKLYLTGNGKSVQIDQEYVSEMSGNSVPFGQTKLSRNDIKYNKIAKELIKDLAIDELDNISSVNDGTDINSQETWKMSIDFGKVSFSNISAKFIELAREYVKDSPEMTKKQKKITIKELGKVSVSDSEKAEEQFKELTKDTELNLYFYKESGFLAGMDLKMKFNAKDLNNAAASSYTNNSDITVEMVSNVSYNDEKLKVKAPKNAPNINTRKGQKNLMKIIPALGGLFGGGAATMPLATQ